MVQTRGTLNDAAKGVNKKGNDATHLAIRISKEVLDHPTTPDPEQCIDLLKELAKLIISMEILERSRIGKLVTKASKTFKRHQRTATSDAESKKWETAFHLANNLLEDWKSVSVMEEKSKNAMISINTNQPGVPRTVVEYRARLVTQKKELYKDPPVLPPVCIMIEPKKCATPKREKTTGALSFVSGADSSIESLLQHFRPNRTPEGMVS